MSVNLSPLGGAGWQFLDNSGNVLTGGLLYSYAAGTTTPLTTYQDALGATPNSNPVVMDAAGRPAAEIWLTAGLNYKLVLKTSTGTTLGTWDNISGGTDATAAVLAQLAASGGSSLIGYLPSGTGAVVTTVQTKLRESVSVKDFGAKGDGTDEYTKILAAWTYCLANGKDLYFPAGIYSSGTNNMPFKNTTYPAVSLLDCGNITIYGDGPNTILRSDSVAGADVLNLYSVKNLHIRNMMVKAAISGSFAGSNGVSVVGGFDNITLDHIWCENLPYVDKASYLDGGKALTIQPGTPSTECGTLKATNIFANGCVYGAGLEVDLVNWSTKAHAIEIDVVAEDCYEGVIFSAGAASGALTAGMTMGYKVKAQIINCQRNVIIGRAHGVNIEANIITTKTKAARRLNPSGGTWNSVDSVVDGLAVIYAKDSQINVYGDVGACDYKAQIGGAAQGSSGLNGATEFSDIYLDLGALPVLLILLQLTLAVTRLPIAG